MSDRTVHARLSDGREVVRYDRAGKWWVEIVGGPRRSITVGEAIDLACVPGETQVFLGRAGGGSFDAAVEKRLLVRIEAASRV
jgi:hypothetical protein